jgi:hypothetical protein
LPHLIDPFGGVFEFVAGLDHVKHGTGNQVKALKHRCGVDQPTRCAKSSLIFLLELLQTLDTFRFLGANQLTLF